MKIKQKITKSKNKLTSQNGIKKRNTAIKKKIPKKNYGKMSFDDFLEDLDDEENISVNSKEIESDVEMDVDTSNIEGASSADDEENELDEAEKHKRDLEKLKESDPEFYKFLQDNDKKLLNFNVSDDENEEEDDNADTEDVHKPNMDLEVASDESDYEETDGKETDRRKITLKMLRTWQSDILTDKTNKTIIALTQAFHACVLQVNNEAEGNTDSPYKVDGAPVFNGVVQLCVLELGPAVRRFLGLKAGSKCPPHKCKRFAKIKGVLKDYFNDLLVLLLGVASTNIQSVLLKHLHYMANLLVSYPNITKSIVRRLVHLWSSGDENVRVLSFFCIIRICGNQQSIFDSILKYMYLSYINNSKFVSLSTLASINFMRRSLVEVFSMDFNSSYKHVFLYIRQLAIHLRNAIVVNNTENVQQVYNWQFINSLKLFGLLLGQFSYVDQLKQLIYPFVQVCLGALKLLPIPQYFPLRFHIIAILIGISKATDIFIPVMPFILEILTSFDFNKKHTKVSMKPMDFTCLLRLSKSQMQENSFKDAVIESIYALLLDYLTIQSNKIAFPDLSIYCSIQLKKFIKCCKNVNYTRKMKQILEKIEQNNEFIEKERAKLNVNLTDFKQIAGWEAQIKNKGTPLSTFYESWNKLNTVKKNKRLTNNEELGDYKLPTIKKIDRKQAEPSDGPVELFPSDSEDDETALEKDSKKKRGTRGGKKSRKLIQMDTENINIEDDNEKDVVEDLQLNDW